ncbi:hypothetical protein [Mobilicoccus sp.]|uniref:hypothetical protein n=1 Tax=Mobilicoccus sp. TaxID=2034349 RepID=UPI0028AC7ECE|nr:hypothetical protein [Mobilicoccus sp.]
MFTLEDLDLTDDLAYIRENGSQFLPRHHDAARDARAGDPTQDGVTDPDADAVTHPKDYLIVGFG